MSDRFPSRSEETKRGRIHRLRRDEADEPRPTKRPSKRAGAPPVQAAATGAAAAAAEAPPSTLPQRQQYAAAAAAPPAGASAATGQRDDDDGIDDVTRALIASLMQEDAMEVDRGSGWSGGDAGAGLGDAAGASDDGHGNGGGRPAAQDTPAQRAWLRDEQEYAYRRAEAEDRARMAAASAAAAAARAAAAAAAEWTRRVREGAERIMRELAAASAEAAVEAVLTGGGAAMPHAPHALLGWLRAEFPDAAATLGDARGAVDPTAVRATAATARAALHLPPAASASMTLALASILLSARLMLPAQQG